MSNNNLFWGRRFGSFNDIKGRYFIQTQLSSGANRNEKASNTPMTAARKAAIKASADYKEANGGPYRLYYKSNGQLDKVRTKLENV